MASYPWSRQSKAKGPYQRARDWVGQHVEVSTAGAFALGFFCNRIRVSLFKRYPNAAKIPYEMIQKNKWIKGKVTEYVLFPILNTTLLNVQLHSQC